MKILEIRSHHPDVDSSEFQREVKNRSTGLMGIFSGGAGEVEQDLTTKVQAHKAAHKQESAAAERLMKMKAQGADAISITMAEGKLRNAEARVEDTNRRLPGALQEKVMTVDALPLPPPPPTDPGQQ